MKILKHGHGASGFTVIELIVAIAIATIVVAIAIPTWVTWLPTLRLSNAARQVATDLQVARMKAISQNTAFQVSISSTTYVIQKCTPSCASPTNDSGNITLPEGITATSSATPQFQPRGTANSAATITLANGSEQKWVCVRIVGRVNLQDTNCT
ncbi:MAG: GspH/FimT family pseudopilin [Candidatus Binatia bacterium]